MKNFWQYVVAHASMVMILGMCIAIGGLMFLMNAQAAGGDRNLGLRIGIAGIVVYVFGRILHASKGSFSRRQNPPDEETDAV